MLPHQRLNIKEIVSPLDLVWYQRALGEMTEGEILEVILSDKDVLKSLMLVIQRSTDQMVYQKSAGADICLGVRKGKKTDKRLSDGETTNL